MPRSFPGSASAGGTGAPEAVSDPQEQRGPVPRSRAPHAGGAQYPAAPGDGSVAPSAPLTAPPLPAGNVSLGRVPTFLPSWITRSVGCGSASSLCVVAAQAVWLPGGCPNRAAGKSSA